MLLIVQITVVLVFTAFILLVIDLEKKVNKIRIDDEKWDRLVKGGVHSDR